MAITETSLGNAVSSAAVASVGITLAQSVAANAIIVVRCGGNGAVTFTCSDNKGNTYTSVGSVAQATAPATISQAFVCKVTTPLVSGDIITIAKSSSTAQIEAQADLVTGVTNTQDGATVTGTPTTQAFTLTAMSISAGSAIFVVGSGGAVLTSITAGTNFTADRAALTSAGTSNRSTAFLSDITGSAGSFTPAGTWQPAGQTYPASFVAFALTAAPAGSTGRFPTTLTAELNRLANGGAYPAGNAYKGEAAAANAWAGTSNLDTIGALNAKQGNSPGGNRRDLDGVCNQLAGTSGLAAAEALRRILA